MVGKDNPTPSQTPRPAPGLSARRGSHPECHWSGPGQSALSGNLLDLFHRLDRLFLEWAASFGAREYLFPTFLAAAELAKLDYFHSFPHLVTFPVALDPAEANLTAFQAGPPLDASGALRLASLAPVREVLTPAACYHFYVLFQGEALEGPRYLTTRATCFRREAHYAPLERQWNFSMREIVCLGNEEEVKSFLVELQARVDAFFRRIGLPISWDAATDPFFNPAKNPKYLVQKLEPIKTEMVFQNRLAIGSVNLHRNYFGEAFRILRGGREAYSGCVAFGLERWLHAFLTHFGSEASDWPLALLEAG